MSNDSQPPRYPDYPGEDGPSGADPVGSWQHYEPGAMLRESAPVPAPPQVDPVSAELVARAAGWWRRAVAHLVDSIVTLVLGLPLVVVGAVRWFEDVEWPDDADPTGFDTTGYWIFLAGVAVLLLVQVLHAVVLQSRTGWTLGKRLVGLRLVHEATGERVRFRTAFGRWAAWVMIVLVPLAPLLDVLWPLWDSQKQTLHDQVAHTLVVRA